MTSAHDDDVRVDIELMSVPWYAQIPKDIAAMYATCSYGKQYEWLRSTTAHLGQQWYAMTKFCETRFAQSERKVYVNFEKNFVTCCKSLGGDSTDEEVLATPDEEEEITEGTKSGAIVGREPVLQPSNGALETPQGPAKAPRETAQSSAAEGSNRTRRDRQPTERARACKSRHGSVVSERQPEHKQQLIVPRELLHVQKQTEMPVKLPRVYLPTTERR